MTPSDRRKRREAWPDIADQSDDWLDDPRDVWTIFATGVVVIFTITAVIACVVVAALAKLAGWW